MVTKWPDWGNRNPLQTSDDDDDDYVNDDYVDDDYVDDESPPVRNSRTVSSSFKSPS